MLTSHSETLHRETMLGLFRVFDSYHREKRNEETLFRPPKWWSIRARILVVLRERSGQHLYSFAACIDRNTSVISSTYVVHNSVNVDDVQHSDLLPDFYFSKSLLNGLLQCIRCFMAQTFQFTRSWDWRDREGDIWMFRLVALLALTANVCRRLRKERQVGKVIKSWIQKLITRDQKVELRTITERKLEMSPKWCRNASWGVDKRQRLHTCFSLWAKIVWVVHVWFGSWYLFQTQLADFSKRVTYD